MISEVISEINKKLIKLFEKVPGTKIYGLAQSMIKTENGKTQLKPSLVDHKGEGNFVGIDDTFPVIIYHKSNSISSTIDKTKAMGDSMGLIVNTYNNSLIIYLSRKKLNLLPDEVYLYLQSHFPDRVRINPFDITIKFSNVILSSVQVWAAEYQTDFLLPPEANLFAVNYIVESSFKKNCFDRCIND